MKLFSKLIFCVCCVAAQMQAQSVWPQYGDTVRFVGIDSEKIFFVVNDSTNQERLTLRSRPYRMVLAAAPFEWEESCTEFVQDSSSEKTTIIMRIGDRYSAAATAEGCFFVCFRLARDGNTYCEVPLAGEVMFLPQKGRK